MSPLVSIVIPCYRQGHWLAQSVESCLNQTYLPCEIVVVDDGSDDETASVSRSFGDRIRYIHQHNAGQSPARNHGLSKSHGEYVLFLDADDALHPQAVEKLIGAANPVTIVMLGWKPFENDVNEPGPDVFPPLENPIPSILRNNPGPPHMVLSPRFFLEKIGGWDPNLSGTSDWDCWYRQLFAGANLVGVPFIGAYYRQSPNQLSRNELVMTRNLAVASEKLYRLAKENVERLRSWNMDPASTIQEFRRRAAKEYAHLAYLHRQKGERGTAAHHYWHSLRLGHRAAIKGLIRLPWGAA